jgi:hypothetical protein
MQVTVSQDEAVMGLGQSRAIKEASEQQPTVTEQKATPKLVI